MLVEIETRVQTNQRKEIMIDHPESRGPFLEPGFLGCIMLLAAPVLGCLFDLKDMNMIIGVLAVYVICIAIGFAYGKK